MREPKEGLRHSWNQLKSEVAAGWKTLEDTLNKKKEAYQTKRAIEKKLNQEAMEETREMDWYLRDKEVPLPSNRLTGGFRTIHLTKLGELYIKDTSTHIGTYTGPYTVIDTEYVPDVTQTTHKKGWVGRTLAGGLIAGPPGAVIGAVTRKTKTNTTDNSILMIRVRDTTTSEENTLAVPCTSREYVRWMQALEGAKPQNSKTTE